MTYKICEISARYTCEKMKIKGRIHFHSWSNCASFQSNSGLTTSFQLMNVIILKQHSKRDPAWRQCHLESLRMIVPQGTFFQRNTPSNFNFPHIIKKYPRFHSFRFREYGLFSGHLPIKAFVSLLRWNLEAWDIITYYPKRFKVATSRSCTYGRTFGLCLLSLLVFWYSCSRKSPCHG